MTSKHLASFIPLFSTYHYQIGNMVPSAMNPSMENWFVNECVLLKCSASFLYTFSPPEVNVENTSFFENPNLNINEINIEVGYNELLNNIKKAINNDSYVYFCGSDDFYLPGKSFYDKTHINHDGLICGYDDKSQVLDILAYDSNWICRVIPTTYSDFEKSLQNLIVDRKWFGFVKSIKVDRALVNIDYYRIRSLLTMYLSRNKYKFDPINDQYPILGIDVHDYICKYLESIINGFILYEESDWRIFRIFWEHKKSMFQRIKRIEAEFGCDKGLVEEYRNIVDMSNTIRLMFARYMQKRDDNLFNYIHDKINDITVNEEYILSNIVNLLYKKL